MKVFCLSEAYGSGDGDTEFSLIAICETMERAIEKAKEFFLSSNLIPEMLHSERKAYHIKYPNADGRWITPISNEMTKENGYIFVGALEDAQDKHCDYSCWGGFVIEENEVLS